MCVYARLRYGYRLGSRALGPYFASVGAPTVEALEVLCPATHGCGSGGAKTRTAFGGGKIAVWDCSRAASEGPARVGVEDEAPRGKGEAKGRQEDEPGGGDDDDALFRRSAERAAASVLRVAGAPRLRCTASMGPRWGCFAPPRGAAEEERWGGGGGFGSAAASRVVGVAAAGGPFQPEALHAGELYSSWVRR